MAVSMQVLSHDELRRLSQRSNYRGALRVGVHLLLIFGAGWLTAFGRGLWLLPAMLLLGIVQAALFAPITRRCT